MIQLFIFNETSIASVYGIGTYIEQLTISLKEEIQINIVNYYSDKKEFTVEIKCDYREFYIPKNQLYYTEGKCDVNYYVNSLYLLHEYIEHDKKLIFHFNHTRFVSLFEIMKEFWPSCKIILSIHYLNWCFSLNGNTSYFKQIIRKSPESLEELIEEEVFSSYKDDVAIFNSVDHIICLCQYTKELLVSEYNIPITKISLIYNGLLDENSVLSSNEKILLRKNLGIPLDVKLILYVGRLDEIKGVKYLIRAFRLLLQERDDCLLIIVGDGNYSNLLMECEDCWSKIIFTGRLVKEQVYKFYQLADVGVMLSKHEQCSYVAIEMMMHELSIIASDSTGLNEMVSEGINGYKILTIEDKNEVSFDINECYKLLSKSLNDKNRQLVRFRSRTRYEERYFLDRMKKDMLFLYNIL